MACLILLQRASLVTWSLCDMRKIFRKHLIYMACILFCKSAERVHISEAYRKMDMTRERISLIFELTVIFLSDFNLVSAAVVPAILASISGLEPSSVIIDPKYLKLVTVSSFCPLTLIYVLMPCVLFIISLVFSALISMTYDVDVFSRRSTKLTSSCSSPAKPSMSSVKRRLVIVLPPVLTVPWWFSKASVMILSRKISKSVGDSRHPCRTPTVVRNQSPMLLLKITALVALSYRCSMGRTSLEPMLYFLIVAQRAACHTFSKAFLKSM